MRCATAVLCSGVVVTGLLRRAAPDACSTGAASSKPGNRLWSLLEATNAAGEVAGLSGAVSGWSTFAYWWPHVWLAAWSDCAKHGVFSTRVAAPRSPPKISVRSAPRHRSRSCAQQTNRPMCQPHDTALPGNRVATCCGCTAMNAIVRLRRNSVLYGECFALSRVAWWQ